MEDFVNSSKYFRESFKGFNKEDVIQFMTKMIKEYSDTEEKYKEELSEAVSNIIKKTEEAENLKKEKDKYQRETAALKVDIQKKTSEFTTLSKEYTALSKEYEQQRTVIDAFPVDADNAEELRGNIEKLSAELKENEENYESDKTFLLDIIKKFELETGLRTSDVCSSEALKNKKITFENNMIDMAEARRKITALEEEIVKIKKENEELLEIKKQASELSSDEEKIYEKITSELGNVIYSAKRTAENIVEKATSESEDIMNNANIKRTIFFEEYEKDVYKIKENLKEIQEIYKTTAEKFQSSYDIFFAELTEVEKSMNGIYDKIQQG